MRSLIAGFVFSVLGSIGATQEVLAPNVGIEMTIQSQVEAFRKDEFSEAFQFASPSIQQLFGTAERFGEMVRNGYPMVWRPKDVQFGDLRDINGDLWQMVIVADQNDQVFYLDYQVVKIDGAWRISAVQILQAPDVSA